METLYGGLAIMAVLIGIGIAIYLAYSGYAIYEIAEQCRDEIKNYERNYEFYKEEEE